jgi:hypothetical protein
MVLDEQPCPGVEELKEQRKDRASPRLDWHRALTQDGHRTTLLRPVPIVAITKSQPIKSQSGAVLASHRSAHLSRLSPDVLRHPVPYFHYPILAFCDLIAFPSTAQMEGPSFLPSSIRRPFQAPTQGPERQWPHCIFFLSRPGDIHCLGRSESSLPWHWLCLFPWRGWWRRRCLRRVPQ